MNRVGLGRCSKWLLQYRGIGARVGRQGLHGAILGLWRMTQRWRQLRIYNVNPLTDCLRWVSRLSKGDGIRQQGERDETWDNV
jgi:hypothetical protein